MLKLKKETYFTIIIVLAMLSWGGSWPSGKLVSQNTPLELIIFWRFFITTISFIPIIILLKQKLYVNKKGFIQIILGAIFLVIYNFFFLKGERLGQASDGGMIVTTLNPLFTFLITMVIFKQSIKKRELIGLTIGLIGGAILFRIWDVFNQSGLNYANSLFLCAALTWAMLSITSQKSKDNMNAFVFSFYTYGIAAIIDFFFAIPKDVFNLTQINGITWFNIFYLSLAATTFGTTAYFFAANKLGAAKASSYTFIVPASAVLFSWLFVNESIKMISVLGGVLALIAVYTINYRKKVRIYNESIKKSI